MTLSRRVPSIIRIEKESAYYEQNAQCPARDAVKRLCGERTIVHVPKKFFGSTETLVYRVRHSLTPCRDQLRISNEHPQVLARYGYEIVDYSWDPDFASVFWGFLFDNSYDTKIRNACALASDRPPISTYTKEQLLWLIDTCRFHWGIAITGWPLLRGEFLESTPFNLSEIAPINSLIAELIGGVHLLSTEKNLSSLFSKNRPAAGVPQGWMDLLETASVRSAAELGYYDINTHELKKLVTECILTMRYDLKKES